MSLDALIKIIPIYVESIESQIREKKFPDKEEYLKKMRKLNENNVPKVKSSFFEGIRLTYKAKRLQIANNLFLGISIISFTISLVFSKLGSDYLIKIKGLSLETYFFILGTISFLLCVIISYFFNAIKGTIYNMFKEIDDYEPKTRTNSTKPKEKESEK